MIATTPIVITAIVCHIIALIQGVVGGQDTNSHLFGVHPERTSYYQLTDGQDFKCLDGSRMIPGIFINDDYCDCMDASDEPGTSACPHGQFFCHNYGYIQKLIPSAWVNDGQCDCCDGSDEQKNTNASCENTCGVLGEIYRQEQERNREIADKGSALRSQYKEQAKQMREQSAQLLEQYKQELNEKENSVKALESELNFDFGPSNVFRPLKSKCFNYKDREYTYTLCLFERATQESTAGMQTELGRWSSWAGPADNLHSRQRYDGGMQCWNGPARSAVVNIVCGVEDKIVSVTEPAKCEYYYEFETPAACPDTDPPEEIEGQKSAEGQSEAESVTESQVDPGLTEDHPILEDEESIGHGTHEEL